MHVNMYSWIPDELKSKESQSNRSRLPSDIPEWNAILVLELEGMDLKSLLEILLGVDG